MTRVRIPEKPALLPKDAVVGLYERHAHIYDRDRGRSLQERAWLDQFLSHVPVGGTVLDVGCGMGEPIARYIIERGFSVVGVDSSPSMIARCHVRFPECTWHVADMRTLALGRGSMGSWRGTVSFTWALANSVRCFRVSPRT